MKKVFAVIGALALLCMVCAAQAVVTMRVSVNSIGVAGNGSSWLGVMSSDGRYLCFTSDATNLVSGDTNGVNDVFVFSRVTGTTTRVSTSSSGSQANGESLIGTISANGRYVVFASYATNLVPGVTNGADQFYRKDLQTGAIICVSTTNTGIPGNHPTSGGIALPTLSSDGRYACFSTEAGNLVINDTNGNEDSFVKDCDTGEIWRVSTNTGGGQVEGGWDPRISGDGWYVVFQSSSFHLDPGNTGNLSQLYVKDRHTDTTSRVSVSSSGVLGNADSDNGLMAFSGDSRYVAFSSNASNLIANDTNGVSDIFVRDLTSGTTIRASTSSSGAEANGQCIIPSISPDGRYVSFSSDAANLVSVDVNGAMDVFAKDLVSGETMMISLITGGGQKPSYAEPPPPGGCLGVFNGRYGGVWSSAADGIVPGPRGGPNQVYFSGLQADPIAVAKDKANDVSVIASCGVVSAVFLDSFYFQQDGIASAGRASGIRVAWTGTVTVGKRYTVTGTMKTNLDGERYIEATAVDPNTSGWTIDVPPLGMNNKTLGGGDWHYDAGTGAGQKGITGGSGLNNIGLLVRTWGKVKAFDPSTTPTWFVIDDGSGVDVRCEVPNSVAVHKTWTYVGVTGISSRENIGGVLHRLLRVRTQADITPF